MTLMTGRNQAAALGMPLGEALNATTENGLPLDGAQLIADVHEAEQVRMPVMLTTSDGRAREVALAVSPVPDAEGSGQLGVVVARDVTAQREVEQAKQDFIATVSHELRTPLTPIKGYLTLLLRPDFVPDQPKRDALLAMMLEQTGQLERLVDDLLSVSRMQHGEFGIRLEHADVREVVRRATRDFSSGSDRAVDLRLPEGPAMAVCDPSRLQQVVGNLLSNAGKYSPPGLPVHVTVRVGAHEVELSGTRRGRRRPARPARGRVRAVPPPWRRPHQHHPRYGPRPAHRPPADRGHERPHLGRRHSRRGRGLPHHRPVGPRGRDRCPTPSCSTSAPPCHPRHPPPSQSGVERNELTVS